MLTRVGTDEGRDLGHSPIAEANCHALRGGERNLSDVSLFDSLGENQLSAQLLGRSEALQLHDASGKVFADLHMLS